MGGALKRLILLLFWILYATAGIVLFYFFFSLAVARDNFTYQYETSTSFVFETAGIAFFAHGR